MSRIHPPKPPGLLIAGLKPAAANDRQILSADGLPILPPDLYAFVNRIIELAAVKHAELGERPMEANTSGASPARKRGITFPGIILGVGLGGFLDGILLHQLLQWHHMLTSTNTDNIGVEYYPADTVHGLRINTVWDGVFHTFTWLAVLIGIGVLYSRVTSSRGRVWTSRVLWGWILVGWGLFNLVEGIIDHHILGIHHVRSGEHQTLWDISFLVLGALLVAGGWLLQRSGKTSYLSSEAVRSDHEN